jgi:TRAP transporter TAXI family solute receptor
MRRLAVALSSVAIAAAVACSGHGQQTRFLSIATGGTGGVYYPYGGALARLLSEKIPNTQVTAEATGASVDNLKLMQVGKVDLAFTLADTLAGGRERTRTVQGERGGGVAAHAGGAVHELHARRDSRRSRHQDGGRSEGPHGLCGLARQRNGTTGRSRVDRRRPGPAEGHHASMR